MADFVTDTQALIKFRMGRKVISDACHAAFRGADRGENVIIIPAVVLMEVMYLFEKNRIGVDLLQAEELLRSRNYRCQPLTLEIIKVAAGIDDIPELHDRMIAATACHLDIPIITNDPVIIASRFVSALQ